MAMWTIRLSVGLPENWGGKTMYEARGWRAAAIDSCRPTPKLPCAPLSSSGCVAGGSVRLAGEVAASPPPAAAWPAAEADEGGWTSDCGAIEADDDGAPNPPPGARLIRSKSCTTRDEPWPPRLRSWLAGRSRSVVVGSMSLRSTPSDLHRTSISNLRLSLMSAAT